MTTAAEVEAKLLTALPPTLHSQAPLLARLFVDTATGLLPSAELQRRIEGDPVLVPALYILAGQHIVIDRAVIAFGAQEQLGQLRVGEIVYDAAVKMVTVNTGGGDYAAGDIDKRQGVFISGGSIVTGPVIGVNWGTINITQLPEVELPPELYHPPAIAGFVGRGADLDTYRAQLSSAHLAVISGMAGVGKTWLAATLAGEGTAAEPDKVFWYTFREHDTFEVIISKLAVFLARHGQDGLWRLLHNGQQQKPSFLLDYLIPMIGGQGYLLCFDDLQNLYEHDDDTNDLTLLEQFVEGIQGYLHAGTLALMITARRLPQFARLPAPKPLLGLTTEDTRHLLESRGLEVPSDLLARLHHSVEGNAMLLTLASGLLQQGAAEPGHLIARLSQAPDVVGYLMNKVCADLTSEQNAILGAVAILMGEPGTRDAIEAVLDASVAWEALHDLHNRYLLSVVERASDESGIPATEGYTQHAIVREFYYDRVLSRRDRQTMHRRAGAYYEASDHDEHDALSAARHFERAGDYLRAVDLVTADVSKLFARAQSRPLLQLLQHFRSDQMDVDRWLAVAIARGRVHLLHRETQPARDCFQEALALLATLPDVPAVRERKAAVYCWLGELLRHTRPSEALSWLQKGLDELAGIEVPTPGPARRLEEARLRLTIGAVLNNKGEYDEAIPELEQCLRLLPEGPSHERGTASVNLGNAYFGQGELQRAKTCYSQAQAIYQQLANYWRITAVWLNLALVRETAGEWAGAAVDYAKVLALTERLGNTADQAHAELSLGNLLVNRGDAAAAIVHIEKCLALARDHGLAVYSACAQSSLADLHVRLQEWDRAETLLFEAERLAHESDTAAALTEIYRSWAQIRLGRGDARAALADANRALQTAQDLGDPREQGMSLRVLGLALLADGRKAEALDSFAQSAALLADQDQYEAARTRFVWGRALLASAEPESGAALLAQAHATFAQLEARGDLALMEGLSGATVALAHSR